MKTLLLDIVVWDLVLDAKGNIAVAEDPYAPAQDASSAIRTFQGECWYNTTLGVPYFQQVLGKLPATSLMKQLFVAAARTVPGVVSAKCFIAALTNRGVTGQVQITDENGETAVAAF